MIIIKTKAIIVPHSSTGMPVDAVVSCSGLNLEIVTSYKYLGVVLDSNINWSDHI